MQGDRLALPLDLAEPLLIILQNSGRVPAIEHRPEEAVVSRTEDEKAAGAGTNASCDLMYFPGRKKEVPAAHVQVDESAPTSQPKPKGHELGINRIRLAPHPGDGFHDFFVSVKIAVSSPTEGSRNLILGLADHYSFEQLEPFILSLRQTGYSGEVVFFYHAIDGRSLDALRAFGVRLLPFRNLRSSARGAWRKRLDRLSRRFHRAKWPFYSNTSHFLLSPVRQRYFLYHRFLRREGWRYERVLLADTRDLVFQSDPFVGGPAEELVFFAESFPIEAGELNSNWVRTQLGQATLDRLKKKSTVCAGTTLGHPAALRCYCERMMATIRRAENQHLMHGDQGLHNTVVYEGLADIPFSTRICRNGESVYTLTQHFDTASLRWNAGEQIVDPSGRVVPILHQYDRHPDLAARLLRRIRAGLRK
jgi:hypothetical protein